MKPKTKLAFLAMLILAGLFVAHVQVNLGGFARFLGRTDGDAHPSPAVTDRTAAARGGSGTSALRKELVVGYLPVTCHLTCPVTNWITKNSTGGAVFRSKKFTDFATVTEEFKSGKLQASFILAPLAMTIRRQGLPLKIVHLGHRDGTTIIVPIDSTARTLADLKGKRIAIPHNYSNQRILLHREMEKHGMKAEDLTMVVVPPPEHPSMLKKGAIDAYIIGEPHAAKAEIEGFGRVLAFTKDIWPNFISCVLAVSEDLIRSDRALVQELVDGIAASGKWIDGPGEELAPGVVRESDGVVEGENVTVLPKGWTSTHRHQAAAIASRRDYFSQPPGLLQFVLTKPVDRVKYTQLAPAREDFAEIQRYAESLGYFKPSSEDDPFGFDDYCDPTFIARAASGGSTDR